MSSNPRVPILISCGVAALVALVIVATRSQKPDQAAHTVQPGASASASSAASASARQPEPLPVGLNFVFDCASLAPSLPDSCGASPQPETDLLALVNSYKVSAVPCSNWAEETFEHAKPVLKALAALDPATLAPLDRAQIQNAVLELLSCRQLTEPKTAQNKNSELIAAGKPLLARFALTPREIEALPQVKDLASAWLGDGANWLRGTDPRFFHTGSDGYARAHRQLEQGNTVADIVRLVLVDESGSAYVSDVVQRIVMRRTQPDGIHLCFGELDSAAAACGHAAVRPLAPARGEAILPGPPPCVGCHSSNTRRSATFGPDTGFDLATTSQSRIKAALKKLLGR